MKKKLIKALPYIALLILFAIVQYFNLKEGYHDFLNSSGLIKEDFAKELRQENERAKDSKDDNKDPVNDEKAISEDSTEKDKKQSSTKKNLKLHALSSLLMDACNNRVLYNENGYHEMPMASTTKIMTCIVALENAKLDEVVTVSSYASSMPDVQLNMKEGEQFYLGDLLYSLMLESHNDTAVAIAEHVGGSVEGFATMMNDKARELGCEHTNFVTPNGLDAQGHYTTARDLAMIASYAIKNKKFIQITNTSSHEFQEIKKGKKYHVSNKNKFLYMMDGAIGVKTGFTNGAGYCFVGAIKRTDRTLISVVLGCGWPPRKGLKWSDTKELMTYGIKNYKEKQIFEQVKLDPIFVNKGVQRYVPLDIKGDLTLLIRDDEKVRVEYDIPKLIQAPIKANTMVGNANYYIDDSLYAKIPIYATQNIDRINLKYCFMKVLEFWSQQY